MIQICRLRRKSKNPHSPSYIPLQISPFQLNHTTKIHNPPIPIVFFPSKLINSAMPYDGNPQILISRRIFSSKTHQFSYAIRRKSTNLHSPSYFPIRNSSIQLCHTTKIHKSSFPVVFSPPKLINSAKPYDENPQLLM